MVAMSISETFISFDTAKLAKEKGLECEFYASTQSLLQKWLRDIHGIDIIIKPWTGDIKGTKMYAADVLKFDTSKYIKTKRVNSYEDALEEGLVESLKLIV